MHKNLKKLREIYDNGGNVLSYVKGESNSDKNSSLAISISYDLQAGSYIKKAKMNQNFENKRAGLYADVLNTLGKFNTILEVGIGEATTFSNLLPRLSHKDFIAAGFDISYSRIQYGNLHLHEEGISNAILFVGDLFDSALKDNSIDIVYTNHTLEPNGGREKEALEELYTITKRYLVLFEPMHEGSSNETKEHIEKHGYVTGLASMAELLGYKVIENKLLIKKALRSNNNTGVIIIEKIGNSTIEESKEIMLACPITHESLSLVRNNYYCKESMLLYPVVDSIPCLMPSNAIIASHFLNDNT